MHTFKLAKVIIRIFVPKNEHSFEHTFFLRYGIILPKELQIRIFLFLRKLNYVNLNLVKFQLQIINQQKHIESGILLFISNGIFSFNAPNFKPLFFGFDTSLNCGTKNEMEWNEKKQKKNKQTNKKNGFIGEFNNYRTNTQ